MLAQIVLASILSAYTSRPVDAVPLTNPHLSALAAWSQTVWPEITPAEIRSLWCVRATRPVCTGEGEDQVCVDTNGAICQATAEQTRTATQALYDALHGMGVPNAEDIAADGSSATIMVQWRNRFVHGADLIPLLNVINAVLGVPVSGLQSVHVLRLDDGSYAMGGAERWQRTAQQWLLCVRDGTCAGLVE